MTSRPVLTAVVILVLALCIFPGSAVAQAPPSDTDSDLQVGLKTFGSYQGGDLDSIDTTTGKLTVHIPLLSYPQLGRLHLDYSIHYDSPIFTQFCDNGPPPSCSWLPNSGPLHDTATAVVRANVMEAIWRFDITDPHNNNDYLYTTFGVTDADGENHHMAAVMPSSGQTQQLRAIDGSGYYAYVTSANWSQDAPPVVYDSNGTLYDLQNSRVADIYGNAIAPASNFGAMVDSIRRSIPAVPQGSSGAPVTCPAGTTEADWNVPAQASGSVSFKYCFINSYILSAIILPNGTSWTFTYEQFTDSLNMVSGTELQKITLPTGGTISYTWQSLGAAQQAQPGLWRAVTSRTVDDRTETLGNGPIPGPAGRTSVCSQSPTPWATTPFTRAHSSQPEIPPTSIAPGKKRKCSSAAAMARCCKLSPPRTTAPTRLSCQAPSPNNWATKSYRRKKHTAHTSPLIGMPPSLPVATRGIYSRPRISRAIHTRLLTAIMGPMGQAGRCGLRRPIIRHFPITHSRITGARPVITIATRICSTCNHLRRLQGREFGHHQLLLRRRWWYSWKSDLYSATAERKRHHDRHDDLHFAWHAVHQSGRSWKSDTIHVRQQGTFSTSIKNALNQPTQYDYDENTGVLNSVTDPNGNTTLSYYDEMNNLISAHRPDGGLTTYTYNYSPPDPSVLVTESITSSQDKQETAIVDGLGRLIQTQLNSDPEGVDYVDTTYDGVGRKATVSNPYRSEDTVYKTQYQYDALSRLVTQIQTDNSTIGYNYNGNTVTVTDEAGKARETWMDGLGRLTKVWEDPNGLKYETDYGYDCLSNLTSVVQSGSRNRSFGYDSLSRLTSATNPESGQITYNYDNDGTLTSKVEHGRNITTTYTPDVLHRITSKTYSNGDPTVHYCYDGNQTPCGAPSVPNGNGVGRRTGMGDASGNKAWWYDALGRTTETSQTVTGYATGNIYYDYNLDGSLAQVTYPSDDEIQYTYNSGGRATQASWQGILQGATLASNISHYAAGAVAGYTNGDGATVTRTYNSRLQPQDIKAVGSQGTLFWLTYNFSLGSDNGNVTGITNNLNQQNSQAFTYDSLNRLYTATFYGGCDQYSYDAWGNLTAKAPYGNCSGESWSMASDSNNRIAAWESNYDGAGNLTYMTGLSGASSFNAENRMTTFSGSHASFLYDGDGRRMMESETGLSPLTTYYWNDESGNVLMESDSYLNVHNLYFYVNGERLAYGPELGDYGLYFYYNDDLGNVRAITNQSQSMCFTSDYYPWGGNIAGTYTNSCPTQYRQFTGKDRDPVMGVDYFGARYYKQDMGRFYSPDWSATVEPVPYAKLDNPQSLNLYSYVENNPLTLVDTDGHEIIYADNLKNAQVVKDSVQAILADPHTSANLSGYVGPNNPNLVIQSGDLSAGDTRTVNPDGSVTTTTVQGNTVPDIQTTSFSSTDINGVTTTPGPETTLNGATMTIDDRTSKGDVPGVMVHESVHAGEAKENPAKFVKDQAAEKSNPNHDARPQEQRANAAQKAYGPEIKQAVKQIETSRKKENQ